MMNDAVTLTWLGHSCWRMEYRGWSLIADPYADGAVPGLAPLRVRADAVYCSHGHGDHNFTAAVALSGRAAPEDFSVAQAVCPHDEQDGRLRGMNTVRLFRFGALSVAHMGDVGCMPGADVLALVRGCDLMLLPVGGYYTVDAAGAYAIAEAARPRAVVPMHYRGAGFGFDVLDTVDAFAARFPGAPRPDTNALTLTADAPRGCVLLRP